MRARIEVFMRGGDLLHRERLVHHGLDSATGNQGPDMLAHAFHDGCLFLNRPGSQCGAYNGRALGEQRTQVQFRRRTSL